MSWEDLSTKPPKTGEDDYKAMQGDVGRALANHPLMLKFLTATVKGACYASGDSLDKVAFREGQRALARTLLQIGGQFDD